MTQTPLYLSVLVSLAFGFHLHIFHIMFTFIFVMRLHLHPHVSKIKKKRSYEKGISILGKQMFSQKSSPYVLNYIPQPPELYEIYGNEFFGQVHCQSSSLPPQKYQDISNRGNKQYLPFSNKEYTHLLPKRNKPKVSSSYYNEFRSTASGSRSLVMYSPSRVWIFIL